MILCTQNITHHLNMQAYRRPTMLYFLGAELVQPANATLKRGQINATIPQRLQHSAFFAY